MNKRGYTAIFLMETFSQQQRDITRQMASKWQINKVLLFDADTKGEKGM